MVFASGWACLGRRGFEWLALAIGMGCLSSCSSGSAFIEAPKLHTVQEAASVNVTALSVAPWENYVDSLQAQFTLAPGDALNLALPQTNITQQKFADALGLGLQAGLPQTTTNQALTTTNSQNVTTPAPLSSGGTGSASVTPNTTSNTTQNNTTVAQTPGQLPASALPTQTAPSASGLAAPTGAIQTDAIMLYKAASAIYQEVTMLNNYLKDGMQRYGYVPYIMRIQISVMPFARNEPYDTYVDIGLFSQCKKLQHTSILPAVVVPLLITDDVERGQSSTAEDIARQLALSVSGVVSNTALAGQAGRLTDRFNAVLASSFNSLFMVSRAAADNVLEVRIGAAANASSKAGFVSLAQSHEVTFLLLVSREHAAIAKGCNPDQSQSVDDLPPAQRSFRYGPLLQVTSTTRMREVTTGKELLPDERFSQRQGQVIYSRFARRVGISTDYSGINNLLEDIVQNNTEDFINSLPGPLQGYWKSMWTGLSTVVSQSGYSNTSFNLPYPARPTDIHDQTIFVHDNCKDTATASVIGFPTAAASQYLASLKFGDVDHRVIASTVTQATGGSPMTMTFPSLSELARDFPEIKNACATSASGPAAPRKLDYVTLVIRRVPDTRWKSPVTRKQGSWDDCDEQDCEFTFNDVIFDGHLQLAQNVAVAAATDTIVEDQKGTATVRLLVTLGNDLDTVTLTFSGGVPPAQAPTLSGYTLTTPNGGLKIVRNPAGTATNPIVLDLLFQSLVAGRNLTVTATGQKSSTSIPGASATLSIPVMSAPIRAKATITP